MNGKLLRWASLGALFGVLVGLPFMLDPSWVEIVTTWIPIAIAALGLNLLTGYNGQVSAGHGALFGVGAYAGALVVNHYGGQFFLGIIGGAAAAFLVGILLGIPALRIRGLALALVTLSFAAVFPFLLTMIDSVTNAPNSLKITYKVPNPRAPSTMIDALVKFRSPFDPAIIADDQWHYFYALMIAVACFVLVRNLMGSRMGRAIVAIRDNEIAAATSGINVSMVKLLTFGISAALAGVGGALFALKNPQLNSTSFTFGLSLTLLVVVVIGGSGTIVGPAIGAHSPWGAVEGSGTQGPLVRATSRARGRGGSCGRPVGAPARIRAFAVAAVAMRAATTARQWGCRGR